MTMERYDSPSSDYWAFLNSNILNGLQSENIGTSHTHVPYRCPIVPCGRLISPSCSLTHFALDHLRIDISKSYHNRPHLISLHPWKIKLREVKCLAVLKIFTGGDFRSSETLSTDCDEDEGDRDLDFVNCSTMAAKFQCRRDLKDDDCFLLVWSTCLSSDIDIGIRMEARHPSNTKIISLMYEGPVKSIYASQNPVDVYQSGDCLTITPGLLKNLVDHDQRLEIIVTYYLP